VQRCKALHQFRLMPEQRGAACSGYISLIFNAINIINGCFSFFTLETDIFFIIAKV
jgi:hypothetical protein